MKKVSILFTTLLSAILLLVLAVVTAAPVAAGLPEKEGLLGTVDVSCAARGDVTLWVNFRASDRSGQTPAHVVDEDGRVVGIFQVAGVEVDGVPMFDVHFPLPDAYAPDECTHPSPFGEITLIGGFNP